MWWQLSHLPPPPSNSATSPRGPLCCRAPPEEIMSNHHRPTHERARYALSIHTGPFTPVHSHRFIHTDPFTGARLRPFSLRVRATGGDGARRHCGASLARLAERPVRPERGRAPAALRVRHATPTRLPHSHATATRPPHDPHKVPRDAFLRGADRDHQTPRPQRPNTWPHATYATPRTPSKRTRQPARGTAPPRQRSPGENKMGPKRYPPRRYGSYLN